MYLQCILTIMEKHTLHTGVYHNLYAFQFRPPIALRTDLSHITTELWEIQVLRMAH